MLFTYSHSKKPVRHGHVIKPNGACDACDSGRAAGFHYEHAGFVRQAAVQHSIKA